MLQLLRDFAPSSPTGAPSLDPAGNYILQTSVQYDFQILLGPAVTQWRHFSQSLGSNRSMP